MFDAHDGKDTPSVNDNAAQWESSGSNAAPTAHDPKTDGAARQGAGAQEENAQNANEADASQSVSENTLTCTISVSCKTLSDKKDELDKSILSILPEDGIILAQTTVLFEPGKSAFYLTLRIMKENKIHFEYTKTPATGSVYIEGIANIYEFDGGDLSGWIYKVNGEVLSYSASEYILKDKDAVEWVYTCDLGRDVGWVGAED